VPRFLLVGVTEAHLYGYQVRVSQNTCRSRIASEDHKLAGVKEKSDPYGRVAHGSVFYYRISSSQMENRPTLLQMYETVRRHIQMTDINK